MQLNACLQHGFGNIAAEEYALNDLSLINNRTSAVATVTQNTATSPSPVRYRPFSQPCIKFTDEARFWFSNYRNYYSDIIFYKIRGMDDFRNNRYSSS